MVVIIAHLLQHNSLSFTVNSNHTGTAVSIKKLSRCLSPLWCAHLKYCQACFGYCQKHLPDGLPGMISPSTVHFVTMGGYSRACSQRELPVSRGLPLLSGRLQQPLIFRYFNASRANRGGDHILWSRGAVVVVWLLSAGCRPFPTSTNLQLPLQGKSIRLNSIKRFGPTIGCVKSFLTSFFRFFHLEEKWEVTLTRSSNDSCITQARCLPARTVLPFWHLPWYVICTICFASFGFSCGLHMMNAWP